MKAQILLRAQVKPIVPKNEKGQTTARAQQKVRHTSSLYSDLTLAGLDLARVDVRPLEQGKPLLAG